MTKIEKDENIQIKMIVPKNGKTTRVYAQEIRKFVRFGKEIRITPKANAVINKPGYKAEYFVETVTVYIGIGKNHVADLVMDKSAWEALNKGEKIEITTTEEFKKKYI